jgi:rRNA maturation endonuclease Nob1
MNMTQELVYEASTDTPEKEEDDGALTVCENCQHVVPKTMLCLYCGSPILFKMPKGVKK